MIGICPYCGRIVETTTDRALAVDGDGGIYCPPGTPGQGDKVFPLHGWEERR